jgi:hypothetical protein
MAAYQYIYVMKGLSKTDGGHRVLKDIWLSIISPGVISLPSLPFSEPEAD